MKEQFIEIFNDHIKRPGADALLAWLEKSDFFTAPASTRFHLSEPGGLVKHSIHVYERLREMFSNELERNTDGPVILSDEDEEKIAICGLLHDICKVNFYDVEMRNRKNERGQWEKYPYYVVNDQLPYGHGEKSVYIISGFMKLTREETMAIRWHMGFSDNDFKAGGFSVGNAFEKFPLALLTHLADLQATYLDEADQNGKNG